MLNESTVTNRLDEAQHMFDVFQDDVSQLIENMIDTDPELALAMLSIQENISINEVMVKHVDARGNITRTKDRETRKRLAYQTTGLTTAKRRLIARKAAKTKRANPTIVVRAMRKKKRAEKRRAAMGLNS